MKRTITLLLVIAISGCSVPAFADEVAVAYAAPAVEDFGTGGFSATWAIVEACDGGGSHSSSDSSQTVRADVGGQNNSVTIHYHSPSTTHAGGRMDGEDAP